METSLSELEEHISYLNHRAQVLTALYSQFLSLGASPNDRIMHALQQIGARNPTASSKLREALEELTYIEVYLGSSSHYSVGFTHGEHLLEDLDNHDLLLPIFKMAKMYEKHYCLVIGRHSPSEPKELADLRAITIQRHMCSQLPADAIVKVKAHRCNPRWCTKLPEYPTLTQTAEVLICANWDGVFVDSIAQEVESTTRAVAAYVAERPKLGLNDT